MTGRRTYWTPEQLARRQQRRDARRRSGVRTSSLPGVFAHGRGGKDDKLRREAERRARREAKRGSR